MQLRLVYCDIEIGRAWRQCFVGQPNVEIVAGDICRVACDAVASPTARGSTL